MKKNICFLFLLLTTIMLFVLNGCGGSSVIDDVSDKINLLDRVEDPTKPTSFSGSVISLTNSVMDYPSGAYLELVSQTNPDLKYVTKSSTRGGFQITDVQPGKYDAYAYMPDKTNPVLTGSVKNINLLGNIPSQMNNILIGRPQDIGIIEGQVTQNGVPSPGATVVLDLSTYGIAHLEDPSNTDEIVYLLSITADNSGQYRFEFPIGAVKIFVAAHSNTSMSAYNEITNFSAGSIITKNITLTNAESPVFPIVEFDIFSTSLEKATMQNLQAAASITRANAEKTRSVRLTNIADRISKRLKRNNVNTSLVENDVYWTVQNSDVGTLGFKVYRGDTLLGDYLNVGICDDPFMTYFFDTDPALIGKAITYYRIRSYAANNNISKISPKVVSASPLPSFTTLLPADNTSVAKSQARLQWSGIAGAKSYLIAIYPNEPNANSIPPEYYRMDDNGQEIQQYDISGHIPGNYWWVIAAYNKSQLEIPLATSGSFSTYRKITITPDAN